MHAQKVGRRGGEGRIRGRGGRRYEARGVCYNKRLSCIAIPQYTTMGAQTHTQSRGRPLLHRKALGAIGALTNSEAQKAKVAATANQHNKCNALGSRCVPSPPHELPLLLLFRKLVVFVLFHDGRVGVQHCLQAIGRERHVRVWV